MRCRPRNLVGRPQTLKQTPLQGRIQEFSQLGPVEFWPQRGVPVSKKLLKIEGFPLKLPENCMILKQSWGQWGAHAPRAPWICWCLQRQIPDTKWTTNWTEETVDWHASHRRDECLNGGESRNFKKLFFSDLVQESNFRSLCAGYPCK